MKAREYEKWELSHEQRWSFWQHFKSHRLGLIAASILLLLILTCAFADFISPYAYDQKHWEFGFVPPMLGRIHFFSGEGFSWRPFVYGLKKTQQPGERPHYEENRTQKHYILFLVQGEEYRLWFLFRTRIHLLGLGTGEGSPGQLFLFGTDGEGKDLFSLVLKGGQITLFIGFTVVLLSSIVGILLGSISGYFGGLVDFLIQRAIEVFMAIPRLALLLALAFVIDLVMRKGATTFIFWGIIGILALVNWAPLARVIRGQVLAIREEEFILLAQAIGTSSLRIIRREILPNISGYLIVSATLAIPEVIILESIMSFMGNDLGFGLKEPLVSWGMLLQTAYKNYNSLPWFFIPAFFLFITILAFNFFGDALRDALEIRR